MWSAASTPSAASARDRGTAVRACADAARSTGHLGGTPVAVATAVIDFLTRGLVANPHRTGKPCATTSPSLVGPPQDLLGAVPHQQGGPRGDRPSRRAPSRCGPADVVASRRGPVDLPCWADDRRQIRTVDNRDGVTVACRTDRLAIGRVNRDVSGPGATSRGSLNKAIGQVIRSERPQKSGDQWGSSDFPWPLGQVP